MYRADDSQGLYYKIIYLFYIKYSIISRWRNNARKLCGLSPPDYQYVLDGESTIGTEEALSPLLSATASALSRTTILRAHRLRSGVRMCLCEQNTLCSVKSIRFNLVHKYISLCPLYSTCKTKA